MRKNKLLALVTAMVALITLAFPAVGYAEPDPASTEPAETPAAESSEAQAPLLIKFGDQSDDVICLQMRLRDLGYYNYAITGYFGEVTRDAVKAFQKENKLTEDGTVGEATANVLFSNSAVRKPVVAVKRPSSPTKVNTVPRGEIKDWFKWVNARWPRMTSREVIDVWTGIKYTMIRVGGYNHADVEPATKADTTRFFKTYGNQWSYDRRPVVVKISGIWVAASTNGQPHGYETIKNNGMYQQVCIHFLNSRTHGTNMVCPEHQRCVRIAGGKR